jgi:hypothetical protein
MQSSWSKKSNRFQIRLQNILDEVSYLLQHLVKVCLWHLLEQGILNLRHEHFLIYVTLRNKTTLIEKLLVIN